jgi:hypothetical protein
MDKGQSVSNVHTKALNVYNINTILTEKSD